MKRRWHVHEDYQLLREMNRLLHIGRAAKPLAKNRLSRLMADASRAGGAAIAQHPVAIIAPLKQANRHVGIAMLCFALAGAALLGGYVVAQGKRFMMSGRSGPPAGTMVSPEALWPPQSIEVLRHLKIQYNGRLSTMDQFARALLTFVTGSDQVDRQDAVQTVFSLLAYPERWRTVPLILVDAVPAREVLGMDPRAGHASFNRLMGGHELPHIMLTIVRKQNRGQPLAPFELELIAVAARCAMLEGLFEQHLYLVSPPSGTKPAETWIPILTPDGYPAEQQIGLKRSWGAFITALRDGYPPSIRRATGQLALVLDNVNRGKLQPVGVPGRWTSAWFR